MDRDNLDDGREEVDKGREMGHWERKIVGKCKIWIKGEKSEKEEIKMETIILQSRTLVKGHSSPINTSDVRLRAIRPPLWSPHQVKVRSTMSGPLVSLWRKLLLGFYVKIELRLLFPFGRTAMLKKTSNVQRLYVQGRVRDTEKVFVMEMSMFYLVGCSIALFQTLLSTTISFTNIRSWNVHGPQRMKLCESGDVLTFPWASAWGKQLQDGLT